MKSYVLQFRAFAVKSFDMLIFFSSQKYIVFKEFFFNFLKKLFQGEIPAEEQTSLHLMNEMCKFIYAKDSTDRLRTRAILCHIYHHAIHDNWYVVCIII